MSNLTKYPRTPHLPWSPGSTNDDKILFNVDHLIGKEVVVTVKMDGENTTIYRDYLHARSLDSKSHVSRDWIKAESKKFQYLIPEGWRVCGENLFAKHSIGYSNLESFFYVFSIWDQNNTAITWDETVEFCKEFNIPHVPILYRGSFDESVIRALYSNCFQGNEMEGYVVRVTNSFSYNDFHMNMAKYVRLGHVQTDEHWVTKSVERNSLRPSDEEVEEYWRCH
jgi:hypothetical protein